MTGVQTCALPISPFLYRQKGGKERSKGLHPLDIPAPAHRRRTLRLVPRNRRLHWRKTAAPSKGGLHESQPAYPGRSIAAGGRWGIPLRFRLPCGALAAPAARWPVNGPPAEPLVAAMPPLCGGTISASAVVFFDGVVAPAGPVGGTGLSLQAPPEGVTAAAPRRLFLCIHRKETWKSLVHSSHLW